MQASVMSNLFGDEARALAPLLNNVDLLRNSLALTADEQKYLNSVGKEFEKRASTSAYKLQRFKSQLGDIALTIGASLLPALNKLLVPLGEIALKFSAWTEANPELVRNIVIATSAIVGFRIALAGLRFVGLLGRGGVLSMLSIGFNTVGRAAIGASRAVKSAVGLQAALGAMSGMKLTGIQTVTTALKAMALAVPGVSAVSGALSAVGAALAAISAPAWGLIAVGVAAVAAAGALMWRYWDRITSVVSGVARAIGEQLQPVFDALGPALEPVKTTITAIGDAFSYLGEKISAAAGWFGSFFEKEVLSESDKAKLEQSAYEVTTRIAEAIKLGTKALYDAGSQLIQSLWDGMMSKIDALIEWVKTIPSRIRAAIGRIDLSNMISLGGLFGGGGETGGGEQVSGHRKSGGPVWPGGSFLVGEEEPEIFSPKTGGNITPLSDVTAGNDEARAARAGASAATVKAAPQFTVSFGDFIFHGVNDAAAIKREIKTVLEDAFREVTSGIYADMGAR